jgi:hypothetical protein
MMRVSSLLVACALAGCNQPTYLPERRPLEARPDGMGGFLPDGDLFVLPVRRPSADERSALDAEARARGLPRPLPWAQARDFAIEIEWSLKNLEDREVQASLSLDGGSEFGDYVPAAYIDPTAPAEDQVPPPSLVGGTPIHLLPFASHDDVFREDELDEAALDLEAIIRYPDSDGALAAPFKVLVRRSSASREGLGGIPAGDVTPAVARLRLTLVADGHVVLDYGVRVRDRSDKLRRTTDRNLYVSTAAMLPPPVAPQPGP